ncbi:hypothetical protein RBB50_011596 [Rhinocladiella similis]
MSTIGAPRTLPPGIYVATLTFFDATTEELDIPTLQKHVIRLVISGVDGIVTLGSNGEAPHLSRAERQTVTREVRKTLDRAGFNKIPIIAGASDASVRGTLYLCEDAAKAGADAVLVLPPSYFTGAMSPKVILQFYHDVADRSPLPLLIYSFPAVSSGIAMDSDLIIKISAHPNIIGTKFTCGDTGKLARVAAVMPTKTPKQQTNEYIVLGGLADFTLQTFVAGGSGCIAGGGNLMPKLCKAVYNAFREGDLDSAMRLQASLALGDWPHTRSGIGGTKAVLTSQFGYGGRPRRPLVPLTETAVASLNAEMAPVIETEKGLPTP